jgi:hypothetical protein
MSGVFRSVGHGGTSQKRCGRKLLVGDTSTYKEGSLEVGPVEVGSLEISSLEAGSKEIGSLEDSFLEDDDLSF